MDKSHKNNVIKEYIEHNNHLSELCNTFVLFRDSDISGRNIKIGSRKDIY